MVQIEFLQPNAQPNENLKYAVICAEQNGQWIFCRHKRRDSWEIPGGHREPGEDIQETARRELFEETGAVEAMIRPICVYSVTKGESTDFGMLFYANVIKRGPLPEMSEMAEIQFSDRLPEKLTYGDIQPILLQKVCESR